MLERITNMLNRCDGDDGVMPSTELYCEGWLLRLVLDWHSQNPEANTPFKFMDGAKWFSEGRLSSPFLPRFDGDPLGELHTHPDGFFGDFGFENTAEIKPKPKSTQLVLVEAKLGSTISYLTKSEINYYDQAARNACCLAYVAAEAKIPVGSIEKENFAFYVIAPESEINKRKNIKNKKYDFETLVNRNSIEKKVKRRADDFGIPEWYEGTFTPFFKKMRVELITWEDVLGKMKSAGCPNEYQVFYDRCVEFDSRLNKKTKNK